MTVGPWREISGVCTRPEHQGRGLARRLMLKLVRRELARGERPFLHVMRANEGARALYRRMGFADHRETTVRVVTRSA
jgi:predicted GNAT family acetyltransferase